MGEFSLYLMGYFLQYYHGSSIYLAQKLCSTKSKKREPINLHISAFLGMNSFQVIRNLQEISGTCLALLRN